MALPESAGSETADAPRDRLLELVRFALVGGSSTALYMAIYALAVAQGCRTASGRRSPGW